MTAPTDAVSVAPPRPFAADRVARLMSMALALACLAILGAYVELIDRQWAVLTWANVIGLAAVAVPPPVALVTFWWVRPAFLRGLWGAQAIALLLAVAAVPLALGGERMSTDAGPFWVGQFMIIGACAAVLAWPVRIAVGFAIAFAGVVFATALLSSVDPFFGPAIGAGMRQTFFAAMFMSLALAVQRAGRLLDEATAAAVDDARATAEAEARRASRQRVEMLVHDSVIVALLAYIGDAPAQTKADAAARALAAMRSSRDRDAGGADRALRDLAWDLQSLTTDIDPDARFEYEADGEGTIPGPVVAALLEAASEALRNSVRHADGATGRQVHVVLAAEAVQVAVLDDGAGFDVDGVGAARLGVRHGIIGRMALVDGGEAQVRSTPGYGTAVILRWGAT